MGLGLLTFGALAAEVKVEAVPFKWGGGVKLGD